MRKEEGRMTMNEVCKPWPLAGTLFALLTSVSFSLFAQSPYLVKDINTTSTLQPKSSSPAWFTALGNKVVFAATTAAAGTELWSTNGTAAGTSMIADIVSGTVSSSPNTLSVVNGVLLFPARDVNHGIELWTSDGTAAGTHLLLDINPGPSSAGPGGLVVYGNRLYFSADDGTNGRELCRYPRVTSPFCYGKRRCDPTPA
jgi:ELWxxDGT repeat protein